MIITRYEQPSTEGKTAAIRSSIKVDDAYLNLRESSQPKGWETKELLKEIGFEDDEVETMLATGIAVSTQH